MYASLGAAARLSLDDGDRSARCALAAYLRGRTAPRFFIDSPGISQALATIEARFPAWRESAMALAAQEARHTFTVYGTQADLGADLAWDRLKRGPGGDALYLLKPHRFFFAPRLALSVLYGADHGPALSRIVSSWMASTEARTDPPGYASDLVAVQRSIALTWVLAFLAASPTEAQDLIVSILKVILVDARYVSKELARSCPNNHLLVSAFFLWYVGFLFPEFAESPGWRRRGEEIWLREIRRQIFDDGSGFEFSMHYHRMACESMAAYLLLNRANGLALPEGLAERFERMLAFQCEINGTEDDGLDLGDGTGDGLFPFGAFAGQGDFARLAGAIFGRCGEAAGAHGRDAETAFWLLGGTMPAGATAHRPGVHAYPIGGYYAFPEPGSKATLVFRTGPAPGVEASGGHMHADLLTVYLTLDGVPFIVEPGTYSYRRTPSAAVDWRGHFLGPSAHSGLSIEGFDPLGSPAGDFRAHDVATRVDTSVHREGQGLAWVEAVNRGSAPYLGHRRGIVQVPERYWLVYDVMPDGLETAAHLSFQFGAQVRIDEKSPRHVTVSAGGSRLTLVLSDGLSEWATFRGSLDPVAGWVSPAYGLRVPALAIRARVQPGAAPVATLIGCSALEDARIEAMRIGEAGLAFRVSTPHWVDCLLLNHAPADEAVEAFGIRFEGALLWARQAEDAAGELRWLDGRSVVWPERNVFIAGQPPSSERIHAWGSPL
ncbi:MAG: alginate lyase family protein [Betaproteobacteria bacterium]|nr:alginate lyase family protein [Betaproteobacteria bacterium]